MYVYICINGYTLPIHIRFLIFLKNFASALLYASASTYQLPFPCNIALSVILSKNFIVKKNKRKILFLLYASF